MRTIKRFGVFTLLAMLLAASLRAQEWRAGRARVEGSVKNEKGEPIAGAKIRMRWKGKAEGPDLTTDKKGKWAMLGLAGGSWNIDFEAPGYVTKQISAELKEAERNPPIDIQLQPAQPQQGAGSHEEIMLGGKKISKEAAEAIEKGNAAMTAKNFAEARAEYLKAITEAPDNAPLLMRVAAAYYGEGNFEEAVKYAKKVVEGDPQDAIAWRMVAEIELARGNLDAGTAALEKVPPEKIKDAQPYLNMGILLYNKKKPAEAETVLTKAIGIQPDLADAYYMRGLARLGVQKKAEAKADFQKYLELAPNGADAKDVREILKTLP
jgi:tetratricopeptide (TPR) repeat protein